MPAPYYRFELGVDLTPAQADENISYIHERIDDALANAPAPVELSSITQSGLTLTFHLSNATILGTATIPAAAVNQRGDWEPETAYFANDLVRVRGVGYYLVPEDHTSETTFSAGAGGGDWYAFQYADQQVQLPLYVSDTDGALTVTRALHLNRLLVFLSSCECTIDDADWLEGDQVHFMNQADGGIVEILGTTALPVRPPAGDSANISTLGGTATMAFLEQLDIMALFGRLDPESTI
jgi:hypothetical protein